MSERTTVTLDDDVAANLRSEVRRSGLSFREVLNRTLRLGLRRVRSEATPPEFQVRPRKLGLRPGLSYHDLEALLEAGEGPHHL